VHRKHALQLSAECHLLPIFATNQPLKLSMSSCMHHPYLVRTGVFHGLFICAFEVVIVLVYTPPFLARTGFSGITANQFLTPPLFNATKCMCNVALVGAGSPIFPHPSQVQPHCHTSSVSHHISIVFTTRQHRISVFATRLASSSLVIVIVIVVMYVSCSSRRVRSNRVRQLCVCVDHAIIRPSA
jgi:hypothetical protein